MTDIKNIPSNKHDHIGNFNSGKIKVKCVINEFCPFMADQYYDINLQVNNDTLKNVVPLIKNSYSMIPGLPGVKLIPEYNPYNNWLKDSDGQLSKMFQYVGQLIREYDKTFSGAEAADRADLGPREKNHFTWDVGTNLLGIRKVYSIFDTIGDKNLILTYKQQEDKSIDTKNKSSFDCLRQDFSPTYVNQNNNSSSSTNAQNSTSASTTKLNITKDANFSFINQISSEPAHWIVSKQIPLFRGQDFFIEFHKTSTANKLNSPANSQQQPYKNLNFKYKPIDANFDDSAGTSPDTFPINYAVASYEQITEKGVTKWRKVGAENKGSEKYDFNYQPYIIIGLEPNGVNSNAFWSYYLIICQNAEPIFVKSVIDSSGNRYSIRLGTYDVSGGTLLNQDRLRISFINHLGNIAIIFSGYDNNPFIIEDHPLEISKNTSASTRPSCNLDDVSVPYPIAIIPDGTLHIMGGNIQTSFMYGPITYRDNNSTTQKLIFPLADAVSQKKEIESPFVVPSKMGPLCALSVRNGGIDPQGLASSNNNKKYSQYATKFYICDARKIADEFTGLSTTKDQNGKNVQTQNFVDSPYMNTDTYLRATNAQSTPWTIKMTPREYSGTNTDLIQAKNEGNRVFYIDVLLQPGSHTFSDGYTIVNCKTPILTNVRIVATTYPGKAWQTKAVDVTENLISISDNWSASDYSKIEHTGTVNFLINKDVINMVNSKSDYLQSLRNKAFYVKIKAGYDGFNYSKLQTNAGPLYPLLQPDDDGLYPLITGIAYGGTITEKAGEITMQCNIKDYSDVLQNSLIFNSPFFDGVRDVNAIRELLVMARIDLNYPGPGYLIDQIVQNCSDLDCKDMWRVSVPTDGGRTSYGRIYALSAGYARLTGGAEWRTDDGEKIMDVISKIAKKSGKVIFFDASGVFHYENFPIDTIIYGDGDPSTVVPQWFFTTSPASPQGTIPLLTACNNQPGCGQLIFNQLTREISVSDVYNNIHVMSSTPNYELILGDKINKNSWTDPDSEGFLGYMKTFFQRDGIFGSDTAIYDYVKHLSKFFRPPVVYKFETLGLPIRCFDIVSVDGQKQMVISVSSNIDAKENKWWMNIEGEWLHGEQRRDPSGNTEDQTGGGVLHLGLDGSITYNNNSVFNPNT